MRDAETAQQTQVLGVVLAADVDVWQQAGRVALDARARLPGQDLADPLEVLGVARRPVSAALVDAAQICHAWPGPLLQRPNSCELD